MTNCYNFNIIIVAIFGLLISSTDASGIIEFLITSPKTVLIEPTVCPNFECPAPDELSPTRKVQGGVDFRFKTGLYHGEAREHLDVHLRVIEPSTNEIIAQEHFRPLADNEWNTPLIVTTSSGFNVTVQLRNKCDNFYHGKRCGRYCITSRDRHWECSRQGERRCAAGWTGVDCSTPICQNGCNGRGRCVSPNQCACIDGFNGTECEQCLPRAGCRHGECLNGKPNTCKCKDGFIGDNCDIDVNICSTLKPCANGGRCSIDSSSPVGYRCECPFDFMGSKCEVPLSNVICSTRADQVCQNGGVCVSMDETTIQCKCRPGFTGKFCESGASKTCSTMKCSKDFECHMAGDVPTCVAKEASVKSLMGKTENKSTRKMETVVEKFEDKTSVLALGIFCIFGLISSILLVYKRIISKQCRTPFASLPKTGSPTSSPVYKICIIEAENCQTPISSDNEPDLYLHRHSPPPAYSSPVMSRAYRSIPMDEDKTSFRV